MGRLNFTGFESQSNDIDGYNASFDETTITHGGSRSMKIDSGAGNSAGAVNSKPGITILDDSATYVWFIRGYYYFVDYPNSTVNILDIRTWNGSNGQLGLEMDSSGKIYAESHQNSRSGASAAAIPKNQWVRIEIKVTIVLVANTSRQATVDEVRVDGVDQSLTATNTYLTPNTGGIIFPASGWIQAPGANKIVYVDDLAWNNDQGAEQNSWPGEGKIIQLLPISDNARDTKWTGGAGGTTNLYDAVNNTPPIGTATETDLTQIEHAGGAAGTTDRYDANMTTYATAGLTAADTISLMQFVDVDGEDITTGNKLLNFEVLSNPVMASPGNVTAGDNIGALGTYPMNWAVHRSAVLYNPSVDVDTSPVMRARRPETASRVASVCFMGIYVEYVSAEDNPAPRTGGLSEFTRIVEIGHDNVNVY